MGSPRYKIGDLVRACFTYFEFYTYPYYEEDDDLFHPWLGIVVLISYDTALFGDEPLYRSFVQMGTYAGILSLNSCS